MMLLEVMSARGSFFLHGFSRSQVRAGLRLWRTWFPTWKRASGRQDRRGDRYCYCLFHNQTVTFLFPTPDRLPERPTCRKCQSCMRCKSTCAHVSMNAEGGIGAPLVLDSLPEQQRGKVLQRRDYCVGRLPLSQIENGRCRGRSPA